jgi:predicted small lipoprotein YifL
MMGRRQRLTTLLGILMISHSLAGCGGIGPGSPNAALTSDRATVNTGETINFDARSSTTPNPTIIDEFRWNFGDGEKKTTKQGVISHSFTKAGNFEVTVEVFNDNGDSDSASILVFVNAIPEIILNIPDFVKTGQEARLDASDSFDPEGGGVEIVWDFDANTDSDGDSDPLNDVDGRGPVTRITVTEAGNITGAITVSDDSGGKNITLWTLRVVSRTFRIVWEEVFVDYDWSGYLEQGETYEIQFQPGEDARLIDVSATLSLTRDILPITWPEDNFTLEVDIPSSGWSFTVITTQENITENSSATIERTEMNTSPESDYTVFADSKEELEQSLLGDPDGRFGQGDWFWRITALECDPDTPVDGVDPDQGNDWTLEAQFVVLVLRVSEVSV